MGFGLETSKWLAGYDSVSMEKVRGERLQNALTAVMFAGGTLLKGFHMFSSLRAESMAMNIGYTVPSRLILMDPMADKAVRASALKMALKTEMPIYRLGSAGLQRVEEATLFAHGVVPPGGFEGATHVLLGGKYLNPRGLGQLLRQEGWTGGILRMASCRTGRPGPSGIFGQRLSLELTDRATNVIAPAGDVVSGLNGYPVMYMQPGNWPPPLAEGFGWRIFVE